MMFLNNNKKKHCNGWQSLLWSFMITSGSFKLKYLLISRLLPSIRHTKYPACFLPQKQSRHAEALGKENSDEVVLVSSLTTAVVLFFGLPYIVVTTAVRYSLSHPPVASWVCNHPPTPVLRSYKSLPLYLHSMTSWDATAAAPLVLQPSHKTPESDTWQLNNICSTRQPGSIRKLGIISNTLLQHSRALSCTA